MAAGVKDLVKRAASGWRRAPPARCRIPADAAGELREAAEGVGEVVWAGLNPAPETPLNVPIGPHRRVIWVRGRLDDFKEIKNALGGTVNDVVLAVVTGALRRWLRLRGVRTEGLELRALVPVSIRAEPTSTASSATASPRCAGRCPSTARDPVERLELGARGDGRT